MKHYNIRQKNCKAKKMTLFLWTFLYRTVAIKIVLYAERILENNILYNRKLEHKFYYQEIFLFRQVVECRIHLTESGLFKAEHLDLLEIEEIETKINRKTANDLIQTLIDTSKKRTLFDEFADPFKIDEEVCKLTTGFYKDEFNVICSYLDEMKDSQIRTKSQALAIYLFWLKTGMSQNAIKAHFRLNDRIEVSRYCEQVR